jgi:hypothetical protein
MKTTLDEMQEIRRQMVAAVNSAVESSDPDSERKRLQAQYGRVWDTSELRRDFEIVGFSAPYVVVRRKFDGHQASLEFQRRPRFYFNLVQHD